MKKSILFAILFAFIFLAFPAVAFAEESIIDPEVKAEDKVDYEKIAEEVYEKLKGELPDGLAQNIVEIINKWEATESEEATFKDRVAEFFDRDNLVSTVSMLFMVVVGFAVYLMKKKQGLSIKSTNKDLIELKNRLLEQANEGKEIGNGVDSLIQSLDKITEFINSIEERLESENSSAEQARIAAIGVATMLRDIFQNSRTIDEAGKRIMNLDYLKAVGDAISVKAEEEEPEKEV